MVALAILASGWSISKKSSPLKLLSLYKIPVVAIYRQFLIVIGQFKKSSLKTFGQIN
jgi:hypothetical protein